MIQPNPNPPEHSRDQEPYVVYDVSSNVPPPDDDFQVLAALAVKVVSDAPTPAEDVVQVSAVKIGDQYGISAFAVDPYVQLVGPESIKAFKDALEYVEDAIERDVFENQAASTVDR